MSEKIPGHLKYTKDHEWAFVEGKIATIGVTHHAQDALGEVVFVELPAKGKVLDTNTSLTNEPGMTNQDPYNKAWMVKLELQDTAELSGLLSADDYKKLVESL
jgi:glycine cleavage system H protein